MEQEMSQVSTRLQCGRRADELSPRLSAKRNVNYKTDTFVLNATSTSACAHIETSIRRAFVFNFKASPPMRLGQI